MLNRMIALSCALAFLPAPASAQGLLEKGVTPTESATLTPAAPVVPVESPRLAGADYPPPAKQHRKDSLWNGVIIGAGARSARRGPWSASRFPIALNARASTFR